jgi:hypothetical protein
MVSDQGLYQRPTPRSGHAVIRVPPLRVSSTVRGFLAGLPVQSGSTLLSIGAHKPQAAAGLSANEIAVIAAAIGAGGSLIGGVVGGWFALRAGHKQWQRDREDPRTERSHQAAMAIAVAVASMEEAVVTWNAHPEDTDALRASFNIFSRTAAVQSIVLTDDALRQRVRIHTELAVRLAALAGKTDAAAALTATVRRHADALIGALDAHVNGNPLPPYQPPPLDNAAGLVSWQPPPPTPHNRVPDGGSSGIGLEWRPFGANAVGHIRLHGLVGRRGPDPSLWSVFVPADYSRPRLGDLSLGSRTMAYRRR